MFRVGCRALRVPGHAAFSTTRRVADAGKPPSKISASIENLLTSMGAPALERARPAPPPPTVQPLKPTGAIELDEDAADIDPDMESSPPGGPDPLSLSGPPTADGTARPAATSNRVTILPYTLHIHASRNNTMLTLAGPGGTVPKKGWISSGVLRFRKANRSSYEAGYQCAAWMFRRIAEEIYQLNKPEDEADPGLAAWSTPVNKKNAKASAAQAAAAARVLPTVLKANIELTLKFDGFGPGRDAVYRALLTQEGEPTAKLVRWITDCTPLKIGGTRAKKMRRL